MNAPRSGRMRIKSLPSLLEQTFLWASGRAKGSAHSYPRLCSPEREWIVARRQPWQTEWSIT